MSDQYQAKPTKGATSKDILKFIEENPSYANKPFSLAVRLGLSTAYVVSVLKKANKLRDPERYGSGDPGRVYSVGKF